MKKVKILLAGTNPDTKARLVRGLSFMLESIEYVETSGEADMIIPAHIYSSDRILGLKKKALVDQIEAKHKQINGIR